MGPRPFSWCFGSLRAAEEVLRRQHCARCPSSRVKRTSLSQAPISVDDPVADIGVPCHFPRMVGGWEKARRMDLRRSTGTRGDPRPHRAARGGDYLIAHACFECRKSWKVRVDTGACPQCGSCLREMGRTFKAPKRSDVEQWQKVQALWSAGFRFWSYRSHPDAEPLPERLRDVDDFIRRNPKHPTRIAP